MSDSFKIDVDEYCEHCGNFCPTANSAEITTFGDRLPRFIHVVTCSNRSTCRAISDFHKAVQNDRKEETGG